MATPTKPRVDYSYTGFQQEQQDFPFPGTQLDNDLAELKRAADDTIDALANVRRSDGALPNEKVTYDSLSPQIKLLVGADAGTVAALATVAANIADVTTTADNIADVTTAVDNLAAIIAAPAAAAAAVGAMTTVIDPQFSTLAIAQAYSPVVAPTYIRTAFYDTNQVAGSGGVYRKNGTTTGDLVIILSGSGTHVGYTLTDTPKATQKGARKDNVNNDAPATQAAHDLALGGVDVPAGTYKMVPGSVSPFTLGNQPNNIYRAIALTLSDMVISGHGSAVFHGVSRPGVQVADVQPVLSTDKNLVVGTVKNITIDGVAFDSNNDGDVTNSNQRFLYAVGVDGLRLLDLIFHSSGARRGYGAHIQNSRNVQIRGLRLDKMTGGLNIRYCEGVLITDFVFYNFSEAIDLDGPSKSVVIRHGRFESINRTSQCIDINDQVDASIGDFTVRLVGNIATINYKTTTPDTYSEYVANSLVRNFQIGKRITLSNITGSQVGDGVNNPSFYIGWDWAGGNHAGAGPVSDITLENIDLEDVGFMSVLEGTALVFKNITYRSAISSAGFAAIDMRSVAATTDQLAYSDLDVQIQGMRVEGAQRGAVKISVPSRAVVDGLITRDNNTLGGTDADLILTSLHTRGARCVVDNCDVEGNVIINGDSTAIAAWVAGTLYKKNSLVTNGGNFYRATVDGVAAAAGGPAGTGTAISDDGTASIATWAGSTAYVVDNVVKNGSAYYICMTAGTSAASGGPTGSDMRILDGTTLVWRPINGAVRWRYLDRPYSVMWGKKNRVRGTVTLQGDAQKYIYGESTAAEVGDLAATGTINKSVFVARRRTLITRVSYQTTADATFDAVNFRSLLLRRYRAGVATTLSTVDTTATGFTAFIYRDGGVTASPAGAYLEPGDTLALTSNSAGTGKALTGLGFTVDYIEY
ncbi:hypothetical protein NKI78_27050 [Mesorhizobium sp. M0400]|uniref:hypothetical protein n=1 Tax=Mesorhizobium sp. M0400 TaxID=2956941 RepID=UPI00333C03CA